MFSGRRWKQAASLLNRGGVYRQSPHRGKSSWAFWGDDSASLASTSSPHELTYVDIDTWLTPKICA